MSDLVNPRRIESIVGAKRHPTLHLGRDLNGGLVVMHSQECIDKGDLSECPYRTLPHTDLDEWPVVPVVLEINHAGLVTWREVS